MRGHAAPSRVLVVAVLGLLGVLVAGAPAFAHARLLSSDPADGASLAIAPERVSLTFNEDMPAEFSTITVIGPDGAAWHAGELTANGPTISTAVRPLGPAGWYEIGYRVVSRDGHPIQGSVAFTLTAPGPDVAAPAPDAPADSAAEPPPESTGSSDGGSPVWPWIAAGVVLVGGGIVAAVRLGR